MISTNQRMRQTLATAILGVLIAAGALPSQQEHDGKVPDENATVTGISPTYAIKPIVKLAGPSKASRSRQTINPGYDLLSQGAICDGRADDTVAIQSAYRLLASQIDSEVRWPSGVHVCRITDTIRLINSQSARIVGGRVLWGGNASKPVFSYISDRNVTTQGFFISPERVATTPIGTAFDIRQDIGPGYGISSGNIFDGNVIEGLSSGGLNIGFEQALGTAGNANNDQMRFNGNEVRNYSFSGWKIDHNQATDDYFSGNQCYALSGIGASCVNNTAGTSFAWFGGFTGGNATADFVTGSNGAAPIVIEGANSEGSNLFLLVDPDGASGSPSPINLIGDRFASNRLNVDGHCVIINSPGPLIVSGGSYGQGNAPCNFYWNPDQSKYHSVFGEIVGVTSSGANSAGIPLLAYAPGITNAAVFEAENVYTDGSGHAIPSIDADVAELGLSFAAFHTGKSANVGPIYKATAVALAQKAAIGTVPLYVIPAPGGAYVLDAMLSCVTSSPEAAITLTVNWTDTSNTAQSITSAPVICAGPGVKSYLSLVPRILSVKASTVVTYSTATIGTAVYGLRINVEGPN